MITPSTALKLLEALRNVITERDGRYSTYTTWAFVREVVALAEQELEKDR